MSLPRMRTAERVMDIIREGDPDTEVTLHYIRGIIKSGRFPVTVVGRKKLVNADALIEYIVHGERTEPVALPTPTGLDAIKQVEI